MNCLSIAIAKGRINAAGCLKLAVFFFCLIIFSGCTENISASDLSNIPFSKDGKLYSFDEDSNLKIKSYNIKSVSNGFTQKAVSTSQKSGWIIAWNKKTQELYHIDNRKKIRSKTLLSGSLVFVNQNYILIQGNSFDENKGFNFALYENSYSGKKINLNKIWTGYIDCFISDCFFTDEGICICGGNREDSRNNVFYITAKGIHKCFSTEKKSDFLRLIYNDNKVFAFLSGRDKSPALPVIYSFNLQDFTDSENAKCQINLHGDPALPEKFDCFFGYGFAYKDFIILPASIEGKISFISYDYSSMKINSVVYDAVGCIAYLAKTEKGVFYLARDPLIADSFYGISFYDGKECKKILSIN